MKVVENNFFLFSIDLEDIRFRVKDGLNYAPHVEFLVEQYLAFLKKHKSHATFFTVGDIPNNYPNLIKAIISEGHEIACHSNSHIPIIKQLRSEFKDDLLKNIDNLSNAGATNIKGYRAPVFSLTERTMWVYEVLTDVGLSYSSSILPAKNPLYGWESFGKNPKKIQHKIWEIPVSVHPKNIFTVPFAGGIYFRTLPMSFISRGFSNHYNERNAVIGYFHPYDIDTKQEYFMHPGINNNIFYNWLMYHNRGKVFSRLDKLINRFNLKIITYKKYVDYLNLENE